MKTVDDPTPNTPEAKETPTSVQIDYVHASSTLDPPVSYAKNDYVTRRKTLWKKTTEGVALHAIANLPDALQVAFRRKMLAIFAIQLFVVMAIVGFLDFYPKAMHWTATFFSVGCVVATFIVGIVCLVLLYIGRNIFPLNWGILMVFTVIQAGFFTGIGVVLESRVGFYNCIFTLLCVLIMIVLAGVRVRCRCCHHSTEEERSQGKLLSSLWAGIIAYLVVAVVATVVHVLRADQIVSRRGFFLTLAFQFVLMLWFSYDASAMYRVMSVDEYMHGVIYFYTDLILMVVIILAVIGLVTLVTAMAAACGDGGSVDCSGCAYCYCPCTSTYVEPPRQRQETDIFVGEAMDRV